MYWELRCFDLWFWQVNADFEEHQNPALSITYYSLTIRFLDEKEDFIIYSVRHYVGPKRGTKETHDVKSNYTGTIHSSNLPYHRMHYSRKILPGNVWSQS
jgi:hypothetical protein